MPKYDFKVVVLNTRTIHRYVEYPTPEGGVAFLAKERIWWISVRLQVGASTGWHSLDRIYRVVPGELSVVTGVPNSGKSEWIDALLCNLALSNGWTFALCSMENKVGV